MCSNESHANSHKEIRTYSGKRCDASKNNYTQRSLFGALFIFSLIFSGCFESKIVTTRLKDPKQNPKNLLRGVFYALPRTIVKVDIPIVKTDIKDAIYKEYANCFFPHQTVLDAGTEFRIDTNSLSFGKIAIADPDQIFVINTQGGMLETRSLEMSLTESGVFVKGTAESENQSLDLLTSTVKDIVGVAAAAGAPVPRVSYKVLDRKEVMEFVKSLTPLQAKCYEEVVVRVQAAEAQLGLNKESLLKKSKPKATPIPSPSPSGPKKSTKKGVRTVKQSPDVPPDNPFTDEGRPEAKSKGKAAEETEEEELDNQRRTEEVKLRQELKLLKALSKPSRDQEDRRDYLEKLLADLDADADFKQAKSLYDKIVELEEKREKLISGGSFDHPLPSDTFSKMLSELDATIKGYKAKYFLGTTRETPTQLTFRMDPGQSNSPRELFKFSTQGGVCELLEKDQGLVIDADFRVEKKPGEPDPCADAQLVKLFIDSGDNGVGGHNGPQVMSQVIASQQMKQGGQRGFYYRVPGRGVARLVIEEGSERELGRDTLSIAQFGTVVSLPASTGGRRTKYALELFEASGGLKNFIMGSDALVKQANLKDITDTASTIVESRKERRKANLPPDELDELERKRKILEEKKKIRELENELSEDSDTTP